MDGGWIEWTYNWSYMLETRLISHSIINSITEVGYLITDLDHESRKQHNPMVVRVWSGTPAMCMNMAQLADRVCLGVHQVKSKELLSNVFFLTFNDSNDIIGRDGNYTQWGGVVFTENIAIWEGMLPQAEEYIDASADRSCCGKVGPEVGH